MHELLCAEVLFSKLCFKTPKEKSLGTCRACESSLLVMKKGLKEWPSRDNHGKDELVVAADVER